ncbi:LacI family DNA-binding transcriptional regulator [Streptomyces sp. 3MP-14]|uniref:LacI family DNA-binding transcriptional regulator n=1 Tax=Streptomyces mimosae TaxID=2586635 RepID=A0A5N6AB90_9ACTN|nr:MULTISPECIES: LacI family DNA-binding transcriptional regulator [Streptomyces]KAB8165921.1 LacI family DNA-binding transcriptional regulator [Streptomyces mimosae]KAB8176310.1 LacI family DNA-binding transcriptional regulator [Streptomyces sp. 3MP-14]
MAQLAGVSQTTVSLVLGGNKQGIVIQEATRQRVLEAARTLGYVPDPAARRLAAASNNLLGVFSFTATFPTDPAHSYYPFLVGVEREAAARGFDLVLFTGSSSGGGRAEAPGALERVRLADGCLLFGRHVPTEPLRRLVADGFPLVHVGRRDEIAELAWVGADYVAASAEVVRHLVAAGHRRIVLVREDDDAPASTDRERGFREGLAGTEGAVVRVRTPAEELTPEWVRAQRAAGVTAFVAEETDTGAAWRALGEAVTAAGLRAPDDVSLALLGSPPPDLPGDGPVTGFDIPRAELGAAAVRALTDLLAGQRPGPTLARCPFRAGASSGPPPGVPR